MNAHLWFPIGFAIMVTCIWLHNLWIKRKARRLGIEFDWDFWGTRRRKERR